MNNINRPEITDADLADTAVRRCVHQLDRATRELLEHADRLKLLDDDQRTLLVAARNMLDSLLELP